MAQISSRNTTVKTLDDAGSIINRILFFGEDMIAGAPGAGVQVAMAGTPNVPFELGERRANNKIEPSELALYPPGKNFLNPTQGGTAPRHSFPTIGSPVHRRSKQSERQLEIVVTPREWNWDFFKHAPSGQGQGLTPTPQETIFHKANITATYTLLTDTILRFDSRAVAPEEGQWVIEMPGIFTFTDRSSQLWLDVRGHGVEQFEQLEMPKPGYNTLVPISGNATGLIFTDGNRHAIGVYARPDEGIHNLKAWGVTQGGTTKKLEASSSTVVRVRRATSYLLFGKFGDVRAAAETLFGRLIVEGE